MIESEYTCFLCKRVFRVSGKTRKRHFTVSKHFCGVSCSSKYYRTESVSSVVCEICHKAFHRCKAHQRKGKLYCSHECSGIGRSLSRSTEVKCSNCGKKFRKKNHTLSKKRSSSGKYFCSIHCRSQNLSQNSYVEVYFESYIRKYKYIRNDRKIIPPLEIDFWFPELKIGVELNGEHHYRPIFGKEKFKKQRKNDIIKKKKCKSLGIKLISVKLGNCKKEILDKKFLKVVRILESNAT